MGSAQRVSANRSLSALLSGPVRLVYVTVIDPARRHPRWRGGEWSLARLDDRLLRDIGLSRSQVHAAALGAIPLGGRSAADSMQAPPSAPDNVTRLKRRAIAWDLDEATAPLARRAARG